MKPCRPSWFDISFGTEVFDISDDTELPPVPAIPVFDICCDDPAVAVEDLGIWDFDCSAVLEVRADFLKSVVQRVESYVMAITVKQPEVMQCVESSVMAASGGSPAAAMSHKEGKKKKKKLKAAGMAVPRPPAEAPAAHVMPTECFAPAICKYYSSGRCFYGAACRFVHLTSSEDNEDAMTESTSLTADGWGPPLMQCVPQVLCDVQSSGCSTISYPAKPDVRTFLSWDFMDMSLWLTTLSHGQMASAVESLSKEMAEMQLSHEYAEGVLEQVKTVWKHVVMKLSEK